MTPSSTGSPYDLCQPISTRRPRARPCSCSPRSSSARPSACGGPAALAGFALAYTGIFLFFFTSIFTNLAGWRTGSHRLALGYWLKQQGVQRGSQPGFTTSSSPRFTSFAHRLRWRASTCGRSSGVSTASWYWVLGGLVAALAIA